MARTPKSRNPGPKASGTIDIDPKDVKRIDATSPVPEEGVSDITSTESMKPESGAKPADERPAKQKSEPAAKAPEPKAMDAEKAKTDTKAEEIKPAAAPSLAAKPDEKPKAQTAPPSTFATKPAGGSQAPNAPVPKKDQSSRSALVGGVIGGLIVLALGAGLQAAGIWPGNDPAEDGRVAGLQTEIGSMRADINQLRTDSGTDTALEDRLAALEAAIAEAGNTPDAEAALAEVEQRLANAGDASSDNAARLDTIEQSLAGLETRLAAVEQTNPGERIIAASALKSAIDRGQPFALELDAYAALGGEGGEVDELRPYAEDGVPTRAQINGEVEDATHAMVAAGSGADTDAGFMDRLSAGARSLVQVRPVGMAEGEDVAAVAARLETFVRHDDYARALLEYESLPEDAQAAGSGFMEKVRARHAADQLIDDALATALRDS